MSKSYCERRKVRQGNFEYLLDDDDRTAWINEGNSGGARVYTLPESVVIEGIVFAITSVEIGAFGTCYDTGIEELYVPGCYEYMDQDCFSASPIKTLHIGKGLRHYMFWSLKSASPDLVVEIDPENPYIKISEDGHMVLSKDGKTLIYLLHDIEEVIIPEGVETIIAYAISCNQILRRVQLPESLRQIERNGISENEHIELDDGKGIIYC